MKLPVKAKKLALSGKELEILRLVADGLTDREIAVKLGVGEETVKTHIRRLYAKLSSTNRASAVWKGIRRGLINNSPLSKVDIQVLRLMARGMTDPEIAAKLAIKEHNVKWHIRCLYAALGVTNRAGETNRASAVAIGLRLGLIK